MYKLGLYDQETMHGIYGDIQPTVFIATYWVCIYYCTFLLFGKPESGTSYVQWPTPGPIPSLLAAVNKNCIMHTPCTPTVTSKPPMYSCDHLMHEIQKNGF